MHPQKAPLTPITPITEALPFQTIAMDFIVKLPESAGFDSILTITDHNCMKMLIAIPCRETITAERVAEEWLSYSYDRSFPDLDFHQRSSVIETLNSYQSP